MPDISMCYGKKCPLKGLCYRFLAKPSYWQTYFSNPPYNKKTQKCEYYWSMNEN